jgi:hypothetical protein
MPIVQIISPWLWSLAIHISLDTPWRFSDSLRDMGCGIGGRPGESF